MLYKGVHAAEDYDAFKAQIIGYQPATEYFPIDRELIEYYYDFSKEPAYRKIADVVDGPLPTAQDLDTYEKDRIKYLLENHLPLKLSIKKAYRGWYRLTGKKIRSRKFREKFFVEEWEKTVDNRINNSSSIQKKEQLFQEIIRNHP